MPQGAPELEPSDSPESALAGNLASVTDDEWLAAHEDLPPIRDEHGNPVPTDDWTWAPGVPPGEATGHGADQ
jgi:hypothetical protein